MAELHSALSTLGPTDFSSVPQDTDALTAYFQSAFQSAQIILDSVPLPAPSETPIGRPRSSTTTSEASNSSELSPSSARSDPLDPKNVPLQKEWGKPLKLSAKENPMGMSVYKVGGKDGRGAWFARRSVHEGLSFRKWKLGLQREFPETLEVQGGPGEGNIRGIGGERRVESKKVDRVGTAEVYHLSAQFPGPSAPRDFVTLLLTSTNAVSQNGDSKPPASTSGVSGSTRSNDMSNHFMMISRPCVHPDCPPRNGFVRGQYESVEFIRQLPRKPQRSASALDLSVSPEKNELKDDTSGGIQNHNTGDIAQDAKEGRQRGKTISFATNMKDRSLGKASGDAEDELAPVEWIMITRSDPGGSVPRFLVERGTPGGIVADAGKFVDWAAQKEHPEEVLNAIDEGDIKRPGGEKDDGLEAPQTNGHLAGLNDIEETTEEADTNQLKPSKIEKEPEVVQETASGGLIAGVSNVALASLETYAPQSIVDRLPGHQSSQETANVSTPHEEPCTTKSAPRTPSISSVSSGLSFASAEERWDDVASTASTPSQSTGLNPKATMSPHEKELAKFNERKRLLNERLAKTKGKEAKDKEELTSREEERIKKAEEKHAKEVAKQEQKYKSTVAKLDAKKRKVEEKDERVRLNREKEGLIQQLDDVTKERDILKEQVGALQKENTALVVRLGKMEDGKEVLQELRAEAMEGNRSRSSSLRRLAGASDKALAARDATVLAKDSPLKGGVEP
ncbi:uncharacterized protein KY384_000966 [Bacidia gigantensis]|uniref:uncharacterized protein n=1 Tax=Bacidia gigantensis TaxID=2732470 RepID=UPI001D03E369|nr:uncharacterized protein KY384_000966 [Bacidia gigantensis]KAG8534122.1 hypothetical protein KY384_000966 [Bacidia gigantensis]